MGWMKETVMTAAVPAIPTWVKSPGAGAPEVAIGFGWFMFMMFMFMFVFIFGSRIKNFVEMMAGDFVMASNGMNLRRSIIPLAFRGDSTTSSCSPT
jgi:hypothetical protein